LSKGASFPEDRPHYSAHKPCSASASGLQQSVLACIPRYMIDNNQHNSARNSKGKMQFVSCSSSARRSVQLSSSLTILKKPISMPIPTPKKPITSNT
jgi:hypothetical protein